MRFSYRDPPFLVVASGRLDDDRPVKNFAGVIERNAVFHQIGIALDLIPLEACRCEEFEVATPFQFPRCIYKCISIINPA